MYLSIPLLLNIWVFLIFLNMNKMAGNTFTHSSSNSMINLLEQIPRSGSKCKVLLWTLTNCYLKKIVLIYISPLSPTERRPAHFTEPGSPWALRGTSVSVNAIWLLFGRTCLCSMRANGFPHAAGHSAPFLLNCLFLQFGSYTFFQTFVCLLRIAKLCTTFFQFTECFQVLGCF